MAWLAVHALFSILPVGRKARGLPLRNGKVLTYRMNAIHAFVLTHFVLFYLHYTNWINLAVLAHMISPLTVASIIISTSMSVVLYVASYRDMFLIKWHNVIRALWAIKRSICSSNSSKSNTTDDKSNRNNNSSSISDENKINGNNEKDKTDNINVNDNGGVV